MKENQSKATWLKVRKLLNDLHLWMGLASGIVVLIVCLTGTIYVFNTEIRELSQSDLYHLNPAPGSQKLSPEVLIARVNKEVDGQVVSIKIPADPKRSYVLTVKKEEKAKSGEGKGVVVAGKPGRGTQYMINPYTGEVLGSSLTKNATIEFMGNMFSLHRWLLLDKIEKPLIGDLPNRTLGSIITGTATILFTLGVLTGIVIWFPKKIKNWKQGLKIKWRANWKRVNHDLHNSLGLYTFILLFLMGVTGPLFSFSWYRDGLRKTLNTYQPQDAPKPIIPTSDLANRDQLAASLLLTDYLTVAGQQLNYNGDHTITLPVDSTDAIAVSKTRVGFFAPAAADKLMLDQYTGAVLQAEIFRDKPFNERISGSLKALHLGDVYGTFSKILYFFACLVATSLPVTGTLIWINKFKKKKARSGKRVYKKPVAAVS